MTKLQKSPVAAATGLDSADQSAGLRRDHTAAATFAQWLDPSASEWCLRTFPDVGTGPGRNYTGTIEQHGAALATDNAAGRGVFLVINAGGHRGAEIQRVRAVFADLDGAPLAPVLAGPLQPHIVVESSPGKWHCYWLCDGLPLDQFAGVQRAIAARFVSDASVCDLPRVMRLPGFTHAKGEPFLSRVTAWNGHSRFTAAQVLEAFPPLAAERTATPGTGSEAGALVEDLGTRHADLVATAARLALAGLSLDVARETLHAEAERGRWSRDMGEDEREAALRSAFAKVASGELSRALDLHEIGFGMDPLPAGAVAEITPTSALRVVRVDDVLSATVTPPRFVVDPLVPAGHLTLFGSHGGSGKSILALAIGAHVAAGKPWAGLPVQHRRVLFVSLEDAGEIVRYRLRKIIEAYQLEAAAVLAGLTILDGSAGLSALMTERVEFGVRSLVPTPTLGELRAAVGDAGLLIVDNASDAYDGPENDRRQVRTFVRELAGLGHANNAGVLLLAHIDKAAARFGSAGNSYSGSSAWHNSARSRLALVDARNGKELVQEKLNLGRASGAIRLCWSPDGVLIPDRSEIEPLDTAPDAEAVLSAIEAAMRDGVDVPTARTGPATAVHVLESLPDLPQRLRGAQGRELFWNAITELQRSERIRVEDYRNAQRKLKQRFAPVRQFAPVTETGANPEQAQKDCANAPVPGAGGMGVWRAHQTGATGAE